MDKISTQGPDYDFTDISDAKLDYYISVACEELRWVGKGPEPGTHAWGAAVDQLKALFDERRNRTQKS